MDGKDTLALLPTGGGKSICFQIPGLILNGICLVVSPLISLMQDQVNQLKKRGIQAEAIDSFKSNREVDTILDNCIYGNVKFLYTSPERLKNELFITRFKKMKVTLVAVDESHCISQWGYDFRPSYLNIAELRDHYNGPFPFLALTATATMSVVDDIQEKLLFREKNVFRKSFKRENIQYSIHQIENKKNRLLKVLSSHQGSTIIYCNTRKKTQEISNFLLNQCFSVDFYHGGLTKEERTEKQANWINDEIRIMVATNAFGMGIDKNNVKQVIHYQPAMTLEGYFQETGRAGRDQQPAKADLFFHEEDIALLRNRVTQTYPEKDFIKKVYHQLGNYYQLPTGDGEYSTYNFDLGDFSKRNDWKPILVYSALKILIANEYITLSEAFFQPSKVQFSASTATIQSFRDNNPKLDRLIQHLMRSYSGLFDGLVIINEKVLAKQMSVEIDDVKASLNQLQEFEIIHYEPQTSEPKITFLQDRIPTKNLSIKPETYEKRRKRDVKHLKTIVSFLRNKNVCRNIQLLNYFGEEKNEPCNNCDVCLLRKNENSLDSRQIQAYVLDSLTKGIKSIDEILENSTFEHEKTLEIVRWMIDVHLVYKVNNDSISSEKPHDNS